jgi:hypothetical protein
MHRHFLPEGSDLLRETAPGFGAEPGDPLVESFDDGLKETADLRLVEPLSQHDRRQTGTVQNFVGIGVTNAAE